MADTVVFIPAWNEEANLPAVLDELAGRLPQTDVLVVDDGSTDGTAEVARARWCGRPLLRREPWAPRRDRRGLRVCRRPRVRIRGPRRCRRSASGRRARAAPRHRPRGRGGRRRSARASRPATDTRRSGTSRARVVASEPPCCDGRCVPRSAGRFTTRRAGCTRSTHARCRYSPSRTRAERRRSSPSSACVKPGLHVAEVPVHMRERASGESKLRGRRAVELVVTVAGTLLVYGVWRRHRRRRR